MRRLFLAGGLVSLLALAGGCPDDTTAPPVPASLRLVRGADGFVKVELNGADRPARALELEITASGNDAVILEDAAPAPGSSIDTVRVNMLGSGRAILFAGDKRGVRLGQSGELARFRARGPSTEAPDARLSITRAVVVDAEGAALTVEPGAPLPLR
ncbi:MAG: hypothetical protein IT384_02610 [Deltaproteobacteria bacterium]|nr:hypothetical protein [Deltaproteobacteria bacterium]